MGGPAQSAGLRDSVGGRLRKKAVLVVLVPGLLRGFVPTLSGGGGANLMFIIVLKMLVPQAWCM